MSCNYRETDVSKISKDIAECKAASDRIAKLAEKITNTLLQNEKNKDNYTKNTYLWNRVNQQFANNIATIQDRIRKIEAERQGDWGTRCGALGQYDYHCQLGNFLNQELYPQLALQQKRYSNFLAVFPKPTLELLQVPNFDNTMVCQACTQCVNQSGNTANNGDINSSINQVNNCVINLEKKLADQKKIEIIPNPTPQPVIETPESSNKSLIFLLLFIFLLIVAMGTAYYFRQDIFGSFDELDNL